ncbi:hypothetical protein MKW92_037746 [Papaver armeniacum]|nr:hypothetical protein MKW92_037746 [Papaver armeniacum]
MRRAYESASTSQRINPNGVSQYQEEDKDLARKVADHYSTRSNQTYSQREASPIIHLKKLNNWIKSVLIHLYTRPGDVWDKARVGYYVGIDIAQGSIQDCRTLIKIFFLLKKKKKNNHHQRRWRSRFTFPARLLCADCFEVRLDTVFDVGHPDDGPFDICSCQFAMHYSWSTEARARRALANVSALLRPKWIFIGRMPMRMSLYKSLEKRRDRLLGTGVYSISFDEEYDHKTPFGIKYKFHLEDAKYDLELVFMKNFHEFVDEYMKRPKFVELMRRLGALSDGNQVTCTLSPDEWEVAYLYSAFVLKKRGELNPDRRRANRTNNRPAQISKDDILYIKSEE